MNTLSAFAGVALAAAIPATIGVLLIVFRRRIVDRQKQVVTRSFGKKAQFLADGMRPAWIVVTAGAIILLGAINTLGLILADR